MTATLHPVDHPDDYQGRRRRPVEVDSPSLVHRWQHGELAVVSHQSPDGVRRSLASRNVGGRPLWKLIDGTDLPDGDVIAAVPLVDAVVDVLAPALVLDQQVQARHLLQPFIGDLMFPRRGRRRG